MKQQEIVVILLILIFQLCIVPCFLVLVGGTVVLGKLNSSMGR